VRDRVERGTHPFFPLPFVRSFVRSWLSFLVLCTSDEMSDDGGPKTNNNVD
jgi:hypothetical protein